MNDQPNLSIYRWYAPFYDFLFGRLSAPARRRAIQLLNVRAGERVIILGIGTGLDLPLLPASAIITATDITAAMLDKARRRTATRTPDSAGLSNSCAQFDTEIFLAYNIID